MTKKCFSMNVFAASIAVLFFTSLSGAEVAEFSNDWESFIVKDQYRVVNNVWNKDAKTGDYTQSIVKGDDFFGWKWNWKGDKNVVLSYPEVMVGDSPWNEDPNLNPGFPFQVGSKKLTVDFDIELQTKGKCNMAFEFWALSALPGNKENISQEVMIWNYNKTGDSWTWARYVGKFKADGIVYDVYHKGTHGDESGVNSNKWTYTAFVARKPFLQGTLNVHLFIDYLVSKKILTNDNYIANLELGNEVRDGTGSAVIKKYDVTVE